MWSTIAWGYLWYFVITDFTHIVSGVPCIVEQRAVVMFYEGRSAVTAVAKNYIPILSLSWIDLRF